MRARLGLGLAAAIAIAFATSVAADPAGDPGAAYRAAEARLAAGDVRGAVGAFVAVADAAPRSSWADDALTEAARAAEKTGQLVRAVGLWRRVVEQYPDSREARRAQVRLADLVARIGAHGEWADVDAEHQRILDAAAGVPSPRAQLDALAALVTAHPDYPRATAARLWIGSTLLRAGDRDGAERWDRLALAHAATADDRGAAEEALGDVLLAQGDYDGAEAAYRAVHAPPHAEARLLDGVDRARGRARLAIVAAIVLLVVLGAGVALVRRDAGSWRATGRALAHPPIEVWYAAPVALLLVALAWHNDPLFGRAVAWTVAGGVVVAWLSGASLDLARARAGRVSLARAAAHGAVALASVVAIAYVVILRLGILDLILETWRNGHDH